MDSLPRNDLTDVNFGELANSLPDWTGKSGSELSQHASRGGMFGAKEVSLSLFTSKIL